MKVIIDTNVILDAIFSRPAYKDAAEKIFILSVTDKIDAFITANSVTDIFYLAHRELHDNEASREIIRKLFGVFGIADITSNDCIAALDYAMNDYEDALLAACAKRNHADYVVTKNLSDYINSPVTAISPEDFIKLI